MHSWVWIALYLFVGGVIATSFIRGEEEPDYGFVTVIMLFWPIVALIFIMLMIATLLRMIRGK